MSYERIWPDNWAPRAWAVAFQYPSSPKVYYWKYWSRERALKEIAFHREEGHKVLFMVTVTKRQRK